MITLVPLSLAVKELHFACGLPGFPGVRRFDCVRWGGPESPFVVLTGHEPGKIRLVAVAPEPFFDGYRPEFSADHLALVGLDRLEDAVVLVIVTLGGELSEATANLLGPLLVNPVTGKTVQAVQRDGSWDTRAALVPAAGSVSGDEG